MSMPLLIADCFLWTVLFVQNSRAISHKAEQDSDLVCQSGVGWMEINEALQKKGAYSFLLFGTRLILIIILRRKVFLCSFL